MYIVKTNKFNKKTVSRGFSLIELIIAIAILVILTGLLAPQFMKYIEKARWAKGVQTLDSVYSALQVAYVEIPQQDKKGDDTYDQWIIINGGKPATSDAKVGEAICESLRESLGDQLMDKIDIRISTEDSMNELDNLSVILIMYHPDSKPSDFYYYEKGMEDEETFPGTYGQSRDNKPVKWQ